MKKTNLKKFCFLVAMVAIVLLLVIAKVTASSIESPFVGTAWSILPPFISIVLALITKEVYSSLFIGMVAGSLLYTNFQPKETMVYLVKDGIIGTLTDGGKVSILIFVILLGVFVELMNRSGGAAAFGQFVSRHIKSRAGIQLMGMLLGALFFIDDGFSCFTTGSVMRPVCDKNGVSRAKLAYIIDSTAAPVCIIAPVSSWAAAITGYVEQGKGLSVFIQAIPYNFYAILSLVMVFAIAVFRLDFGPMAKEEQQAICQEITEDKKQYPNSKAVDLIIPVTLLVVGCVVGMAYTGGFFEGKSFVTAISECDAPLGFIYGSSIALIITAIYYRIRKVMSFTDIMNCLPEGIKLMIAPMIILVFAWTLKNTTSALGTSIFVGDLVSGMTSGLQVLLPAVIFLIAAALSFSTGTSWGTFGLLIPITLEVFPLSTPLGIICLSASMAGAVFGDHCSPISDTTIMASAAAGCHHVVHVSTQLPYAFVVAGLSFIGYLFAGVCPVVWIVLPVMLLVTIATLFVLKKVKKADH